MTKAYGSRSTPWAATSGPSVVVPGAAGARPPRHGYLFFGDEKQIRPLLDQYPGSPPSRTAPAPTWS